MDMNAEYARRALAQMELEATNGIAGGAPAALAASSASAQTQATPQGPAPLLQTAAT